MIHSEMNDKVISNLFNLSPKHFFLCTTNDLESDIIENDFVREQTLAFISKEIYRRKTQGSVAELGVYKGQFSKKINTVFPDKKMYLFDTFTGFDDRDIKSDMYLNKGDRLSKFDDTNVNNVISIMPHPEMCEVKKGFFPDTFDIPGECFSYVSIDVDLYEPIKRGLEIFYPRLAKGGYIMIHDYNTIAFDGSKNAVQEFCDKNDVSIVPLPDIDGTAVITK